MDDDVWQRTSESWKRLRPNRKSGQSVFENESVAAYHKRIKCEFDIPLEVAEQWLHPHYYRIETTNNYGWINYSLVSCELCAMKATDLKNLNVITKFQLYLEDIEKQDRFEKHEFIAVDRDHWMKKKTWRIAPVAIDIQSFTDIPEYAELNGPFQLIEGHTRLGLLKCCLKSGVISEDSLHAIYILRSTKQ